MGPGDLEWSSYPVDKQTELYRITGMRSSLGLRHGRGLRAEMVHVAL